MIAVVIPTVKGREDHLDRCIRAYREHTDDLRIYIEYDHPSCGSAWQAGAKRAAGHDYLHLTADDLEPHEGWASPAIEAVDAGFIPAPLVFEPDGSLQSAGINGWDVHLGPYDDWMTVESTTVPFMSAEQWERIGMIDLHYATDLWISWKGRREGWDTVIRTGMAFTHYNAMEGRGDQHGRTLADRAEFQRITAGIT